MLPQFLQDGLSLVLVSILWGATNPLLKRYSIGVEKITDLKKEYGKVQIFFAEQAFLLSRWKYVLSFLINISGSVLFYYLLSNSEISLIVPVTNSLTFVFTIISELLVQGGKPGNWMTYTGIFLIILGVTICVQSKLI